MTWIREVSQHNRLLCTAIEARDSAARNFGHARKEDLQLVADLFRAVRRSFHNIMAQGQNLFELADHVASLVRRGTQKETSAKIYAGFAEAWKGLGCSGEEQFVVMDHLAKRFAQESSELLAQAEALCGSEEAFADALAIYG